MGKGSARSVQPALRAASMESRLPLYDSPPSLSKLAMIQRLPVECSEPQRIAQKANRSRASQLRQEWNTSSTLSGFARTATKLGFLGFLRFRLVVAMKGRRKGDERDIQHPI